MASGNGDDLCCPACRGTHLSDEADYASFDNHARFRDWSLNFLGASKDLTVGAGRARVCLDCGYMLLFAGHDDLEKLRSGPQR